MLECRTRRSRTSEPTEFAIVAFRIPRRPESAKSADPEANFGIATRRRQGTAPVSGSLRITEFSSRPGTAHGRPYPPNDSRIRSEQLFRLEIRDTAIGWQSFAARGICSALRQRCDYGTRSGLFS